jgi:hypothetical protein
MTADNFPPSASARAAPATGLTSLQHAGRYVHSDARYVRSNAHTNTVVLGGESRLVSLHDVSQYLDA